MDLTKTKKFRLFIYAVFFVGTFVISLLIKTEMPATPLALLFLFPFLGIPLVITLMMKGVITKFPRLIPQGALPFNTSNPKILLEKLNITAFYSLALGAGRLIAILVAGNSLHDDLLIISLCSGIAILASTAVWRRLLKAQAEQLAEEQVN